MSHVSLGMRPSVNTILLCVEEFMWRVRPRGKPPVDGILMKPHDTKHGSKQLKLRICISIISWFFGVVFNIVAFDTGPTAKERCWKCMHGGASEPDHGFCEECPATTHSQGTCYEKVVHGSRDSTSWRFLGILSMMIVFCFSSVFQHSCIKNINQCMIAYWSINFQPRTFGAWIRFYACAQVL